MHYSKEQLINITDKLIEVDTDDLFEQVFEGSKVTIGGYEYDECDALKTIDPIAYRESMLNYIDTLVSDGVLTDEIDGNHYNVSDVEELLGE